MCCLDFDLFGRRLYLRLPSGSDIYQTHCGAFLSLVYLVALLGGFGFYGWLMWQDVSDDLETWEDYYKFSAKMTGEFGGVAVVFYYLFMFLARCCTQNKMENYLVTELFSPEKEEVAKKKVEKDG